MIVIQKRTIKEHTLDTPPWDRHREPLNVLRVRTFRTKSHERGGGGVAEDKWVVPGLILITGWHPACLQRPLLGQLEARFSTKWGSVL